MEIKGLLDVNTIWETVVLPHEVGQGVVPVGRCPFRQEDRVVEVQLFISSQLL